MRLVVLIGAITLLVIVMVYAWKHLPYGQRDQQGQAPITVSNQRTDMAQIGEDGLTRSACESSGGIWTDCGSSCRGKAPSTNCIEVCVPQCVCGNGDRWHCPKEFVCADYLPDAMAKNAIGVCRKIASSTAEVATSTTAVVRPTPPGMICDATNSICATTSLENALLTSPFVATGTAVAFEQTFAWKLIDGNGETIEEGRTMTSAPDVGIPGPFSIRAFILSVPKTATGTLMLYESSAKDGEPIHIVKIPVKLPTLGLTRNIYLLNDPNACTSTVAIPVTFATTKLPVEATLRSLLLEREPTTPTTWNALSQGVELKSLKVSGGVATAGFSAALDEGVAGSCRVSAIRTQIESTLKQFPSVSSVIISAEGKTPAETLQP